MKISKEEIFDILANCDYTDEKFMRLEEHAKNDTSIQKNIDEVFAEMNFEIPKIPKKDRHLLIYREKHIAKSYMLPIIAAAAILLIIGGYSVYLNSANNINVPRVADPLGNKSGDNLKQRLTEFKNSIANAKQTDDIKKILAIVENIDPTEPKDFKKHAHKIRNFMKKCNDEDLKEVIKFSYILENLEAKNK